MAIKPVTPKGTRDFSALEIARRNYMRKVLQKHFECFAFEPIETPSFERLETLMGQYGEEGDRLIFKILNSGEKVNKADLEALKAKQYQKFSRSLSDKALRYDLTVPFARYVAQHQNEITFPFRRYQIQPVWRADRPQHGRFQEFYQCDADIVGERSLWQEVEVLLLYASVFDAFGLKGVTIKLNHRKILAGIAHRLGAEELLIDFTVALDKLDKIGREGVLAALNQKGFSQDALQRLEPLFALQGSPEDKLTALAEWFQDNPVGQEGLEELQFIIKQLRHSNFNAINFDLDLTLARGLHYYTGMIVEVAPPDTVKMGSIGGGGRYDNLTGTFGLKNRSGIGISFGFERLYLVLEALDLFPENLEQHTEVLFLNFGSEAAAKAFEMMMRLRKEGISCAFYPIASKPKKQMTYANQKSIPWVVFMGSEEIEKQQVILKHMESGEQIEVPLQELSKTIYSKINPV